MCRFIRQTWGCLGETGPGCCDPVGTGSHWRAAGLATEGSYQRCKHRVRPRCQAHAGQSPLPRRVGGSCMHVLAVATGTVSPATPRGSQCPGHEQGSRWQGLAADSRGDAGGGGGGSLPSFQSSQLWSRGCAVQCGRQGLHAPGADGFPAGHKAAGVLVGKAHFRPISRTLSWSLRHFLSLQDAQDSGA